MFSCIDNERGQAAVEAAFLLPVFLLVLGLMLEPALLFYNRCVMNAAAAEGCRMLETNAADEASAKAFVLRRLAAIPNADAFHYGGKDAWDIELSGAEGGDVQIKIVNRVRPLPLLGISAGLVAQRQSDGTIKQQVQASAHLWPSWAVEAGADPASLAGEWK